MEEVPVVAGAQGKRYALSHSRVVLHPPEGRAEGQSTEIEIVAREFLRRATFSTNALPTTPAVPSNLPYPPTDPVSASS
jgi:ATP-dependent Clp protease protease subunit